MSTILCFSFVILVLSLLGVDLDHVSLIENDILNVSSAAVKSSKVSYSMHYMDIIIFSGILMESATQKSNTFNKHVTYISSIISMCMCLPNVILSLNVMFMDFCLIFHFQGTCCATNWTSLTDLKSMVVPLSSAIVRLSGSSSNRNILPFLVMLQLL